MISFTHLILCLGYTSVSRAESGLNMEPNKMIKINWLEFDRKIRVYLSDAKEIEYIADEA
jgi:hypothetical protein